MHQTIACWMVLLIGAFHFNSLLAADDPSSCRSSEYRQFDFWLGSWDVYNAENTLVGKNKIESVLGGCGVHESWQSEKNDFSGYSYNIFDVRSNSWHQTWIDTTGSLLLLKGGLDDAGRMVLQGRRPKMEGTGYVLDRITWTPNPDGSVEQRWESSEDGGTSWDVVFNGLYKRAN